MSRQALTLPAAAHDNAAAPPASAATPRSSIWHRRLVPSLSDCVFLFLILWLFVVGPLGWERLLQDADAGWHIRVGESILDGNGIPSRDPFSFSKPGAPWFAWEWLSDVTLAAFHRLAGLKGVVWLAGGLIALFGLLLVRYSLWRGAGALPALAVALLGLGGASVHYLARPHLFTLIFLTAALWIVERDLRKPTWLVWTVVALTALWTNLHGAFPALLACLAVVAAASPLEAALAGSPRSQWWRRSRRYALLTASCAAASVANPYGITLHRHIFDYLRSDWIRTMIMEFQSPDFRSENLFQFEILLFLGLMAAAVLLARRRLVEAVWILMWAHQALTSVRHVPIFVIVAAPIVASEATRLMESLARGSPPRSVLTILGQLGEDLRPGFRRTSIWPLLLMLIVLFTPIHLRWPRDFPADRFPLQMIDRHADAISRSRLFTDDQWGGYLLYRFHPVQRVFIDGRSDFYGPEIGNQYVRLSTGQRDWREILDRHAFDLVLAPPDWPLVSLLRQSPDWVLRDADSQALLFARQR